MTVVSNILFFVMLTLITFKSFLVWKDDHNAVNTLLFLSFVVESLIRGTLVVLLIVNVWTKFSNMVILRGIAIAILLSEVCTFVGETFAMYQNLCELELSPPSPHYRLRNHLLKWTAFHVCGLASILFKLFRIILPPARNRELSIVLVVIMLSVCTAELALTVPVFMMERNKVRAIVALSILFAFALFALVSVFIPGLFGKDTGPLEFPTKYSMFVMPIGTLLTTASACDIHSRKTVPELNFSSALVFETAALVLGCLLW